MNRLIREDRELSVDLESGRIASDEGGTASGSGQVIGLFSSLLGGSLSFDGSVGGECDVNSYSNSREPSEAAAGNSELLIGNISAEESGEDIPLTENKRVKEKYKTINYKKAAKPPRPPKGPLLDAADLQLVREISVLAMKRRARNERAKALRKMREGKSSSSYTSLSAMIITIFFFLIILFQGFCARSSCSVSFQGSPEPAVATNGFISVQLYDKLSANDGSGLGSVSPSFAEQASGSNLEGRDRAEFSLNSH
ncbi:uncharacterized protein LOC127796715 isoform X1 [Diospyros lotus]|uniref:uncharacterized protein LOC127796715 isoform X1 n=1 Tax=Diospyros lotus TaxID=55363 RepID=UPI00224C8F62|nr:uncharacterized protein LOC127796715 isoform X1 [Diospyros lotus]XP_052184986.1 uncharacterized protein LOC127796715 isoform X1 [Diospyros lotus]